MFIDSPFLSTIFTVAMALLAALLGLVVLFRGRRLPWLFSGAAAFLLGVLLVRILEVTVGDPTDSTSRIQWEDWIPIIAGVLGVVAGRLRLEVAFGVIGLAAGGELALWVTRTFIQAGVSTDLWLDFWSALVILAVMGLGMLFVQRYGQVALIVLSAGVGPALIVRGLSLPLDSSIVAAVALAAGIAGLVVQYHDYLVEHRVAHRKAEAEGILPDSTSGEITVAPQTAI